MTAPIVDAWGQPRGAVHLELAANTRQSEDNLHSSKRAVPCETCGYVHAGEPGQLWERAAESWINGGALTVPQWSRICRTRNELGTRSGRLEVRGATLADLQRRDANRARSILIGLTSIDDE